MQVIVCGAAPIPISLLEWYQKIGISIHEIYGMTENCGYSHGDHGAHFKHGTVGRAWPGVESKLGEDGEILIRHGALMKGYFKDQETTATVFTPDGFLKTGDKINLERGMLMTTRLDGHIVQGHVDMTGVCTGREDRNGSWLFTFQFPKYTEGGYILVNKGSICVNGVSLTVVNPADGVFSVAIIPYTFEHTTFHALKIGDTINLEFDVIGKYIAKYFEAYKSIF